MGAQFFDESLVLGIAEISYDAVGNARADVIDGRQVFRAGFHEGVDRAEGFGQDAASFGSDEADAQGKEDPGQADGLARFDGFEQVIG